MRRRPRRDRSPMTGTYVAVIVVEALIIVALWLAGVYFSS